MSVMDNEGHDPNGLFNQPRSTTCPTFEDAWEAFNSAYRQVMDEHSGTEPTKAMQAGVRAVMALRL